MNQKRKWGLKEHRCSENWEQFEHQRKGNHASRCGSRFPDDHEREGQQEKDHQIVQTADEPHHFWWGLFF